MDPNSVFLISDFHLGHTNIIKYESRPFADVEEMSRVITAQWNKVIKSNDQLAIILGDFAMGNRAKIEEAAGKLHGRKWLLLGNHDRHHGVKWWEERGFERAFEYPILFEEFFLLSHEPVYLNEHMPYANIHGHIHSKTMTGGNYLNVSVEHLDYTPITFEEAKRRLVVNEQAQVTELKKKLKQRHSETVEL
jgi:calcineurin-like phosphoesterase family protein